MDDPRLENVMTYTVFHIGVYLSLFTAIMGVRIAQSLDRWFLQIAAALFVGAGIAGSAIGSNIPKFIAAEAFFEAKFGPWGCELLTYHQWATIEHGLFWAGFAFLAIPGIFFRAKSLNNKDA